MRVVAVMLIASIVLVPSASAARRDCVDLPFELGCPPQDVHTPRVPSIPNDPGLPRPPGPPSLPPVAPPTVPPVPPVPGLPSFPPTLPGILDDLPARVCASMPPIPASTRPVSERLRTLGYGYLADDVEGFGEYARQPGERCAQTIG